MSRTEELEKRVRHLETEVELLKELVKLQNKTPERIMPICPQAPTIPWYKEPYLTCKGKK